MSLKATNNEMNNLYNDLHNAAAQIIIDDATTCSTKLGISLLVQNDSNNESYRSIDLSCIVNNDTQQKVLVEIKNTLSEFFTRKNVTITDPLGKIGGVISNDEFTKLMTSIKTMAPEQEVQSGSARVKVYNPVDVRRNIINFMLNSKYIHKIIMNILSSNNITLQIVPDTTPQLTKDACSIFRNELCSNYKMYDESNKNMSFWDRIIKFKDEHKEGVYVAVFIIVCILVFVLGSVLAGSGVFAFYKMKNTTGSSDGEPVEAITTPDK